MGFPPASTSRLTYGDNSVWLENADCRLSPPDGSFPILLARCRIQGISSLTTPCWALEVPGSSRAIWAEMLKKHAPIVVLDFPVGEQPESNLAKWKNHGWWLQRRHTRWLDLKGFHPEGLPKQRRKQWRRAKSHDWMLSKNPDVQELTDLHSTSRLRKKIANDEHQLQSLCENLIEREQLYIQTLLDENRKPLASGGFIPQGKRLIYAFGGTAAHNQQSSLAVVQLLISAMECAAEAGYDTFDFGGSMDPGVDQFYKEFGAQSVDKWRAVHVAHWARPWIRWRRPDLLLGSNTFAA